MRLRYHALLGLAIAFAAPLPALAHELWIEAITPRIAAGGTIEANVRVGENMRGGASSYSPNRYRALKAIQGRRNSDIDGRIGDRPAIKIPDASDGLVVLALASTASHVSYKTFEKFEAFANAHGQSQAAAQHKAEGNPKTNFSEVYFRYAKALVPIGAGEGMDAATGMPFELVALTNPYTEAGNIRLRLLQDGAAVPGHHVDIFTKTPGTKTNAVKTILITNSAGEITVPRAPGQFLINAVRIIRPISQQKEGSSVIWQSDWASLTYWIQ